LLPGLGTSALGRASRGEKERVKCSAYQLKTKREYGHKTRIDMNQSFQVAYWKERFGVTEQELSEGVRAAGALARKVETYLRPND
jgi:uncharacterized protein DUF3606